MASRRSRPRRRAPRRSPCPVQPERAHHVAGPTRGWRRSTRQDPVARDELGEAVLVDASRMMAKPPAECTSGAASGLGALLFPPMYAPVCPLKTIPCRSTSGRPSSSTSATVGPAHPPPVGSKGAPSRDDRHITTQRPRGGGGGPASFETSSGTSLPTSLITSAGAPASGEGFCALPAEGHEPAAGLEGHDLQRAVAVEVREGGRRGVRHELGGDHRLLREVRPSSTRITPVGSCSSRPSRHRRRRRWRGARGRRGGSGQSAGPRPSGW